MIGKVVVVETITPLHVGAGTGRGEVDLPVDRDGFGFPFIPSSGLKGALREKFPGDEAQKDELFGTEKKAGLLVIQDFYLLAIPARSLRGVWALVTSPLLLKRAKAIAEAVKCEDLVREIDVILPKKEIDEILVSEEGKNKLEIEGKVVLNEDFELTPRVETIQEFGSKLLGEEAWRFCVVNDNLIRDIVDGSLLRRARVALEKETKKVREGGLWTEEDIPPRSFFLGLCCLASRSESGEINVEEVWKRLERLEYLILGGHETIGRGLVRLKRW